jgi:hypothetical protein
MAKYSSFKYNTKQYNAQGDTFWTYLDTLRDAKPRVKVEFVDTSGVATDVSRYYAGGGNVTRLKERAPDEIQAGDFDVVLHNHDDYFSEYKASSLLYGIQYHGARVRIWIGFELSDGSITYQLMQVGYIDQLETHDGESKVTFRCRDILRRLLDEKLHQRPSTEVATPGSSNAGGGSCSVVSTKPFKTVNESWTLTCTTPGADGVAVFSVVGSVSGTLSTATAGTEYSTGTGAGGIKFTLKNSGVDFAAGDTFTFQTKQYPEWTAVNPAKIIWSILTGYNWDTNTQEAWSGMVLTFDPTQSSANTDLDYQSFVDTIALLSSADNVSGYAAYDEDARAFIEGLLILFLGSVYTGNDGRIKIQAFRPTFGGVTSRTFSDTRKIMALGYNRAVSEILNYFQVQFKLTNSWEFSDEQVVLDGMFVMEDTASQAKYKRLPFEWESRWYSASGNHVEAFGSQLLSKYSEPPLTIRFKTGLDAVLSNVGERISITDEKYGFTDLPAEITAIEKVFDGVPMEINVTARRDEETSALWGFLGSSADEGDGLSPQSATYGSASVTDLTFCYLGTAGLGSPDYRMF